MALAAGSVPKPRPWTMASYQACGALPALVAVHAVVAAADHGDAGARVSRREARLEVGDEAVRRAGRRVATVEQPVDDDVPGAGSWASSRDGHRVAIDGVHAAGADEADEVQARAALGGRADRRQQDGVLPEGAVGDRGVDARQVLEHRPAGAQVEVADLAVAHLAVGQADGGAGGVEAGMRPLGQQGAPARHVGGGDGIHGRVRPDAEAVDDDEHDRARSVRARGHSWVLPSRRSPDAPGTPRQAAGRPLRRPAGRRRRSRRQAVVEARRGSG